MRGMNGGDLERELVCMSIGSEAEEASKHCI
jgi:hypothetical protein